MDTYAEFRVTIPGSVNVVVLTEHQPDQFLLQVAVGGYSRRLLACTDDEQSRFISDTTELQDLQEIWTRPAGLLSGVSLRHFLSVALQLYSARYGLEYHSADYLRDSGGEPR